MMYLKQFPDICREMGFDVEEKEKIVTLCVTDINSSYRGVNLYTHHEKGGNR